MTHDRSDRFEMFAKSLFLAGLISGPVLIGRPEMDVLYWGILAFGVIFHALTALPLLASVRDAADIARLTYRGQAAWLGWWFELTGIAIWLAAAAYFSVCAVWCYRAQSAYGHAGSTMLGIYLYFWVAYLLLSVLTLFLIVFTSVHWFKRRMKKVN